MDDFRRWIIDKATMPFRYERPLIGSQRKVLLHIAKKGPKIKYEIEKEAKINHASVHDAITELEKQGALESESSGTSRVGLEIRRYRLTLRGFCLALKNADRADYKRIVQKWAHLEPMLLGNWDYFEQKVGKELTEGLFLFSAFIGSDEDVTQEDFRVCVVGSVLEYLDEAIALFNAVHNTENWKDYVLGYGDNDPREGLNTWLAVFSEDSDLKKCVMYYIQSLSENITEQTNWVHFLKQKLKKPTS